MLSILRHLPTPARCALAIGVMAAMSSAPAAPAQSPGVIEESDAILGKKNEEAASASPATPAGVSQIGVADHRALLLFHPLMQYLVSTAGNAPLLYFLPPGSSELTKLFDERRAHRMVEVRREMTELAESTAAMQQELFGMREELNHRLGSAAAAASESGPAKGQNEAAARKLQEEGYWKKKADLTERLATANARYGALDKEIQDPLKLLEQTRQVVVTRIRKEIREAIARVAAAQKLAIVVNAYSPAPSGQATGNERAPETADSVLAGNEYKEFLNSKATADKTEPLIGPRRLLTLWDARGGRVESIFGPGAGQTVLYGGQDITWPALNDILVRYKVPQPQIAQMKAHFETRRER